MKNWLIFFLAGFVGTSECASAEIAAGEPFPVEKYGVIGAGNLYNSPIGFFDIDGRKCLMTWEEGWRRNKGRIFLYELTGDVEGGAPLFKLLSEVLPPTVSKNGVERSVEPNNLCRVIRAADGKIYGFWNDKSRLVRSVLDTKSFAFSRIGEPLPLSTNAVVEGKNGEFFVYSRGATTITPSELSELYAWNRNLRYVPFDGSLIWRGGEYRDYMRVSRLSAIDADSLSAAVAASPTDREASKILGGSSFTDKKGKTHLFVGTSYGLTLHYTVGEGGILEGGRLCRENDTAMRMPFIKNSPVVSARNGNPDLYTGGEAGIHYCRFKEFAPDGTPVYETPVRVRRTDTNLYFGGFPMVDAFDWDGDGLTDIVAGNSQGQVMWSKNVGRIGKPKFAEPEVFKKDDGEFIQKGGYWNVQGPSEAQFGYVDPTVFDWDEDEIPDILTGDSTSRFGVYFNTGSRKAARFAERKLLYCDGMEVHGTWRQRPAVAKLGNGKTAYVIADWDDKLRLYWRLDKFTLVDGGRLLLTDGKPINATGTYNGECGREKLVLADIDGDGKMDLLMGTIGNNRVPEPERGISRNFPRSKRGAAVLWLRNVGDDNTPPFSNIRLSFNTERTWRQSATQISVGIPVPQMWPTSAEE